MILPGLALSGLIACGAQESPTAASPPPAATPRALLGPLVERFWDQNAASSPWYSWGGAEARYGEAPADLLTPQALANSLALEQRYLTDLAALAREPLDAEAKLTYDAFRRERQLSIESYTYPTELLPVNPYDSLPQRFAVMAAAAARRALASDHDFEVWRSRVQMYERWTDQAISNLREGLRRGYTLPLDVVTRTLPVLESLGEDAPTSVFYEALGTAPDAPDDAERARRRLAMRTVVKERILPSYRRLHDFLQTEYRPRARTSVGWSALPLGPAWYAFLVKRATDGARTPAELHALGVAEVERLRPRLQAVLAETAFPGNARGFVDSLRNDPRYSYKTGDELLSAYRELEVQVAAAAPALFSSAPHADFEIRGVETFRATTAAPLSYRPSLAAGRTAAVLYVDTVHLDTRPAIAIAAPYLREAVPGKHYLLALQQDNADLPRFRRYGGAPSFIEGWALYAASLGEELGVYRSPDAKLGAVLGQLECAAGVVIDTGLHAQNWSRAQALDYLRAQLPLDELATANLVDRAVALPANALSCLVGFNELQSLRAHAQQTLGSRFDVRAFHAEILKNGALPLDLLDGELKRWIEAAAIVETAPPTVDAASVPVAAGDAASAAGAAPVKVEAAAKLE